MGRSVDPPGQTAHSGPSRPGQGVAEGLGQIEAIPGALPRAHDRNGGCGRGDAEDIEAWGILQIVQAHGVIRSVRGDHPQVIHPATRRGGRRPRPCGAPRPGLLLPGRQWCGPLDGHGHRLGR